MFDDAADEARSVFRIGAVAELLGVHPRTLRLYEDRGLVVPSRKRGQRRYSHNDIRWLRCLRRLLHEEGFGLDAIGDLIALAPCWEVQNCPLEARASCPASRDRRLRCWQLRERVRCVGDGTESCEICEIYQRDIAFSRRAKLGDE